MPSFIVRFEVSRYCEPWKGLANTVGLYQNLGVVIRQSCGCAHWRSSLKKVQ